MPEHPLYKARLIRSLELSEQTKHLEFRVDDQERFDFKAGQFVSVKERKADGREQTRAYSIASPPRGDRSFDLCLNRVEEGFMSNYLCSLDEGQEIRWHGPHGLFTLKEPVQDSLFVCTGTGVAPFRSMLHYLFADPARNAGHDFWLIFGTRYEEDLYYAAEFREMERRYPNFHYIASLSRAKDGWKGARGYVQEHVRRLLESVPNRGAGSMHAYICGLFEMVDANRKLLAELGWDRKSVFYERYD
ncbi:MAG TPA: FAD-binding oxidoreductase [Terriglobales bacterium]|jgi:ferredoxin-NADP reductase|nr:FAD-binding oxidoreductase [Terriglobales bacterium]